MNESYVGHSGVGWSRVSSVSTTSTTNSVTTSTLPQGTYYWRVKSEDLACNASSYSGSRVFFIDTTAPNPPPHSSPSNGSCTNNTGQSFSWGSTGGNYYQIQIDNNSDFSSPVVDQYRTGNVYTPSGGTFSTGTYYWHVRTRDPAGNWSNYYPTFTLYVDTAAPDTTITSAPSGTVASHSATLQFTSNESGVWYQWKMGTSNWVGNGSNTSMTFTGNVPEGTITFQVRAIDSAGNSDPSPATATWTVDTIAPGTPTLTSPDNGSVFNDTTPTLS